MENAPQNEPIQSDALEVPNLAHTSLEQIAGESLPEAEKVPNRFKQVVKTIADAWFDPKSFEEHPGFYERFGIRAFKKYMPSTGDLMHRLVWKKLGLMGDFVESGNLKSLKDMQDYTKVYEAMHMVGFAVMSAEIAVAAKDLPVVALGTGLNILVNIYPIMLQRYNRMRLYRAIQRMETQQQRQSAIQAHNLEEIAHGDPENSDIIS